MWTRLRYWLPAIAIAILISLFSTHYFSSDQTARVIYPIVKWLLPGASPHLLHIIHVGIRKLAHVTEFGVFSITVYRGVQQGRPGWRLDWALITLLIAVGYAALDEWHQAYVPLRQSRPRDVLIDACGALLAQVLVWIYARTHARYLGIGKSVDTPGTD